MKEYSWSITGEVYYGRYPSVLEALREARQEHDLKPGKEVLVGEVTPCDPTQFIHAGDVLEDVLERMGEAAGDEVGDPAEDWPPHPGSEVFNEYATRLEELLNEFAEKHCPVDFWRVDGAIKYRLTEDGYEVAE